MADKKLGALPVVTTHQFTDQFYVLQSSVDKRTTLAALAAAALNQAADYAGISFDDNAVETVITWAEVYHLIDKFDTDAPDSESTADAANQRCVIGQTRTYDVAMSVTAEAAVLNKNYEFRVFEVAASTTAITDISQADPCVVTATGHPHSDGDEVKLADIVGMVELNDHIFYVSNSGANTFEIQDADGNDIDSTGLTPYESGGTTAAATPTAVNAKNQFGQQSEHLSAGPFPVSLTEGNYLEFHVEGYTDTTNITVDNALLSLRILS